MIKRTHKSMFVSFLSFFCRLRWYCPQKIITHTNWGILGTLHWVMWAFKGLWIDKKYTQTNRHTSQTCAARTRQCIFYRIYLSVNSIALVISLCTFYQFCVRKPLSKWLCMMVISSLAWLVNFMFRLRKLKLYKHVR